MDWNSDGQWDLMSGDVSGYLNIYVRDGDSLIPHEQYRLIDGTVLDAGYNSFPAVFDWNGDGNKDLLVGTQDSTLLLYINQGGDTWPMFQECEMVRIQDSLLLALNRVIQRWVSIDDSISSAQADDSCAVKG